MEGYITKPDATTRVYRLLQELSQEVRNTLSDLIGTKVYYSQPLHYLNYAFKPYIPLEKAKAIATLGNFLMELEIICSTIEDKENYSCPIKLVSHEEYLQVKKDNGNYFIIFFEGTCCYGRHAIYINDFNPYDIYYIYVPTIQTVIEQSKNLGSLY